jgi:uncharacterized membrane protein YraQ (UPF0718 family)
LGQHLVRDNGDRARHARHPHPWAPIVAFMVASPLTSPEELLLSAGLFGWPFALTFLTGTIALGSAAGG